jgi:hypothetical protein
MLIILKNRLHRIEPKKGGDVFYVECANINSEVLFDIALQPM